MSEKVCTKLFGNLHVNLARLDHAQLHARFFFHHLELACGVFQVIDFGFELRIFGFQAFGIFIDAIELELHLRVVAQASTPKPMLPLKYQEQCQKDEEDDAARLQ